MVFIQFSLAPLRNSCQNMACSHLAVDAGPLMHPQTVSYEVKAVELSCNEAAE